MYTSLYLVNLCSAILFILSLKGLASPKSASKGNMLGMLGMAIVLISVCFYPNINNKLLILLGIVVGGSIGVYVALKIRMNAIPQLIAGFHSFVGLAAVLIAIGAFVNPEHYGIGETGSIKTSSLIEITLGALIGAVTFSGSIIACLKLLGFNFKFLEFKAVKLVNAIIAITTIVLSIIFITTQQCEYLLLTVALSVVLGILLVGYVGGADMPVVVSMLNSYSGWAACGIGFTLSNPLLIITGAIVGASGAILSYIMCKAMNRSLLNVLFGGISNKSSSAATTNKAGGNIKSSSPEDAAFILKNASSVIIVPGYGMAVARAQNAVKELNDLLEREDISVKYAIHPVAGRMPGHMNVLLAEAGIEYDKVFELEDINREFSNTDVVIVIGANDVTNPAAKTDKDSPIYGMPILDVNKAKSVFFLKRSMAPGYSGVENQLFFEKNTFMLFGDAKSTVEHLIKELENLE
ncbi:MAG: NAD(P)(+) transhydrogenase (Re/Si-specific) subunit beta [Rickettsiales bacterium]|nr:NAD(P)(+) transhydrogenase (Re/Si-specific) subunit beta [Rickettsiales bacterium]